MDEQLLKCLLQEHSQLSSAFDKHASIGYSIPPIVLTGITGVLVFIDPSKRFIGIGVHSLVLGLLIWVGISHSILNYIGLRLVELELRINGKLQPNANGGITFYTRYIAEGTHIIHGLATYFVLVGLVAIIVVGVASFYFWASMASWPVAPSVKVGIILFPVSLNVAAVVNMCIVERKTRKEKCDLIKNHTNTSVSA